MTASKNFADGEQASSVWRSFGHVIADRGSVPRVAGLIAKDHRVHGTVSSTRRRRQSARFRLDPTMRLDAIRIQRSSSERCWGAGIAVQAADDSSPRRCSISAAGRDRRLKTGYARAYRRPPRSAASAATRHQPGGAFRIRIAFMAGGDVGKSPTWLIGVPSAPVRGMPDDDQRKRRRRDGSGRAVVLPDHCVALRLHDRSRQPRSAPERESLPGRRKPANCRNALRL